MHQTRIGQTSRQAQQAVKAKSCNTKASVWPASDKGIDDHQKKGGLQVRCLIGASPRAAKTDKIIVQGTSSLLDSNNQKPASGHFACDKWLQSSMSTFWWGTQCEPPISESAELQEFLPGGGWGVRLTNKLNWKILVKSSFPFFSK